MAIDVPAAEWTIRPSVSADETALCALFDRAFGREMSRAEWSWKHSARQAPAPNVWLAVHDGQPIFHTSGIPTEYKLLHQERMAMISVDTMTDPGWRRRGLLTAVGKVAYDAYRAAGVAFVIGIINEKWGSRANALGWQELFPLVWQIRPLIPEAFLTHKLNRSILNGRTPVGTLWNAWWDRQLPCDPRVRVTWCDCADERFDALWSRVRDSYAFSIVRDRAWMQWRFFDSPQVRYHLALAERNGTPVGYVATRVLAGERGRVGVIADLFAARDDPNTVGALVRFLLEAWRAQGFTQAATVNAPGTRLYRVFRRAGFLWSVGSFNVQAIPLDPSLPFDRMRDAVNWHMAGSDYDDV